MRRLRRAAATLQQDAMASVRPSNMGSRVSQAIHARRQPRPKLQEDPDISKPLARPERPNEPFGNGVSGRMVYWHGRLWDACGDGRLGTVASEYD